jgi:DHA2 family multidrug resistance protein-like MFS transporter
MTPDVRHAPAVTPQRPPPARWWALAVLTLALLLVAVDATVLGLAMPFLSEELRPSSTQLLWIGDVYSFVIAGLLVSMGGLGDRIGRKKLLLSGAAAFGVLSVLAAYASTPGTLIAARGLMGVAGATLMPSTLALIRNLFSDPGERSFAIGVWGSASMAGAAVGPVVGGFLLEHFWWGSVFLINIPVMAVLVLFGARLLPESRNPAPGPWDMLSVLLSLIGMVGIVYAVKETAAHGFGLGHLAAGAAGLLCIAGFVHRQLTIPAPLLDMRLFRNRGLTASVLADLLTVLGISGTVFFLSQFFQMVQGLSPLRAGLAEIPATLGAIVTGLLAGNAARRYSVRAVVAGGLAAIGVALAALVAVTPDSGYPLVGAVLLVVGIGAGFSFTVTADVILSSVPQENAGAASAVSETAYELGAALGIAFLGSIITGRYAEIVIPNGVPAGAAEQARQSLPGAVDASAALPEQTADALRVAAQNAFTGGLRMASAVGAAVLLMAAGWAWRMLRGQKLGGHPTDHGRAQSRIGLGGDP